MLDVPAISAQYFWQLAVKLPNGRAADQTNMAVVMVKHASEEVHQHIAVLLTSMLRGEVPFPPVWKLNNIWMLFHHEDYELLERYRPNTLLPMLYKLYARIVLDRIKGDVDKYFAPDSVGYRAAYSCEDHMFTASEMFRQVGNF